MAPQPGNLGDLVGYMIATYWSDTGEHSPWPDWHNQGNVVIWSTRWLDTDAEKEMAQQAMQLWADVANITFTYNYDVPQLIFDDEELHKTPAAGTNTSAWPVVVNISLSWLAPEENGTGIGSGGFKTYVHEIGHALGLGHPGNYNRDPDNPVPINYDDKAGWDIDTWQASIMSYFSQPNYPGAGADWALPMTPQMADILAVQFMYGAATNTRDGDTTYGFNSTAGPVFDFSSYTADMETPSLPVALTIYDSGGIDTLDCSGFSYDQRISLWAESYSDIGGVKGNVGIFGSFGLPWSTDTIIENAISGSGKDTILGNDAPNTLQGGGGDDYLYGYGDNDDLYGDAGLDTLEGGGGDDNLSGGDDNDTLYGDNDNDNLYGGTGEDTLDGGPGDDNLYGGANDPNGGDILRGGEGNDLLVGDSVGDTGNDILDGGPNADILLGGAGIDTASYSSAEASVTVNLADPSVNTGDAGGDTYADVENVIGSDYDDILAGDSKPNILDGAWGFDTVIYHGKVVVDLANSSLNAGEATGDQLISVEKVIADNKDDDVLFGDDKNNWFVGSGGNDLLNGRGGADKLDGGPDNDTVTYADAPMGVTADLSQGSGGWGAGKGNLDTFISIENLIGSKYVDVLTGDTKANVLDGGDDKDLLFGGGNSDTLLGGAEGDTLDGGAGDDTLDGGLDGDTLKGGSGSDTASYAHATAGVIANLSNPSENDGEALKDTYQSIENITGSDFDDKLTGNGVSNKFDGGDGIDTVFYADSFGGVIVSLATGTGSGGTAAGDTLVRIENLVGSSHSDTLTGDSHANTLDGGVGEDILAGGGDKDLLLGGDGNDTLEGGKEADILNGGFHNDTASYAGSVAGVTVNLMTGTATGGDAEGDTLTSIENLIGSNQKDHLTGDAGDNKLYGLGGNDTLNGGSGMDTLEGGANNDKLLGGADSDTFIFDVGFGIDTIKGFDDTKSGTDQDVICFDQSVFTDFAAVENAMSQVGSSVFITVDSQNHIELFETSLTQFGADDFLFI